MATDEENHEFWKKPNSPVIEMIFIWFKRLVICYRTSANSFACCQLDQRSRPFTKVKVIWRTHHFSAVSDCNFDFMKRVYAPIEVKQYFILFKNIHGYSSLCWCVACLLLTQAFRVDVATSWGGVFLRSVILAASWSTGLWSKRGVCGIFWKKS